MNQQPSLPEADEPPASDSGHRSLNDGDLSRPVSLDEFFGGLGSLMHLPPKARQRAEQAKQAYRRTRRFLPAAAVVLGVVLAVLRGRPVEASDTTLPDWLLGRWETSAKGYSGRVLEFLPDRVVFHNGLEGEEPPAHPITRILTRQAGDTTAITLTYLADGQTYEIPLRYLPGTDPELRFTNQGQLVWRPAGRTRR